MNKYKNPALTVDAIVKFDENIVLIKRAREPFKGAWALPGGFVEYGENVEMAMERELEEETGLKSTGMDLFGVYSDPHRDPRGHTVSLVFIVEAEGVLNAGDDASDVRLFPLKKLPPMAFDHERIVQDYKELCS
ncbi:MAG TPA: NUDIX hydrolase [Euryarchaeota archaeon]|nr:NUDIX hydrolase [Euryarchaeota archaeon]